MKNLLNLTVIKSTFLRFCPSGPVTIAGRQAASLPLHEINVSDRPVTAAGGMSMGRTQIESGNDRINERQVRDASYYLALLKNKETEIITETERLEHDIAVMKQESNSIGKSKDESEKLLVEIGDLEGNLSLLNLAIDKYRAGEDPDDMIQFQQQLKKKNDLKANEVDIVFLARQKAQNKILNIERSINDANHTVVNYLKNVGQAYLEQYNDLIKEQENILLKKKKFEDKNGAIKTNIYSIQNELKRKIGNDITQEFKEYEKRIKDLKRSIKEIDEDINIFQMDSKEAHVYLLKKVKSAKQNTLNLDATIKEKDMEKLELMKEKSILQSEVDNNRIVFFEDDGAIPLGLDAMILKDKDMTNSLEMAKTSFNKIKIDHDQTKSTISLLLEHLSESIVASKIEAPTIAQMEILQNDVSFKTKQLQNSEQTMVMLEEQKKKRGDEVSVGFTFSNDHASFIQYNLFLASELELYGVIKYSLPINRNF